MEKLDSQLLGELPKMSNYEEKSQQLTKSIDASSFRAVLEQAISKRERQGQNGIPEWTGPGKTDQSKLTYRNFWMHNRLLDLAEQIHRKEPSLCPYQWAAWMMCVNLHETDEQVKMTFPSHFRKDNAVRRFSGFIERHFAKMVKYQTSQTLRESMVRQTAPVTWESA